MTTLEVQVVKDTARPALAGLQARARSVTSGLNVAARALGNLLKSHFRAKSQAPNKLGGSRTFFWLGVSQGVNAPKQTGPESVAISITHPAINQKIHGGTITAKRGKFLTIPIHPAAHGRRVSVLERTLGLKLFRVKNVLAAWDKDAKKLTVYYALARSVTQKPDATALPPREEMQRVVSETFNKWMAGPATN